MNSCSLKHQKQVKLTLYSELKNFFNMKVSVLEHNSLNKTRGIIKDRTLEGETEENIVEYLAPQGVIACKRFRIKKKIMSK